MPVMEAARQAAETAAFLERQLERTVRALGADSAEAGKARKALADALPSAAVAARRAASREGRIEAVRYWRYRERKALLRRGERGLAEALEVLKRTPESERTRAYWRARLRIAVILHGFDSAEALEVHEKASDAGEAAEAKDRAMVLHRRARAAEARGKYADGKRLWQDFDEAWRFACRMNRNKQTAGNG